MALMVCLQLSYADIAMFQALWAFTDPEDPFYTTLPEPISQRFGVKLEKIQIKGQLVTMVYV